MTDEQCREVAGLAVQYIDAADDYRHARKAHPRNLALHKDLLAISTNRLDSLKVAIRGTDNADVSV